MFSDWCCAAKAFCDCPAIISHRPRSQNILKERALNPESQAFSSHIWNTDLLMSGSSIQSFDSDHII